MHARAARIVMLVPVVLALDARAGRAEEPTTATRLPVDRVSDARPGEWVAFRLTTRLTLARQPERVTESTVVWRIAAVEERDVVLAVRGRSDDGHEAGARPRRLTRGSAPTLELLFGSSWPVSEVREADDTRDVGGRSFRCKRLTYSETDPLVPQKTVTNRLWLSTDVPCGGIVIHERVQRVPGTLDMTTLLEVTAFGDENGAKWGSAPDPALLRDLPPPAQDEPPAAAASLLALEPESWHEYRETGRSGRLRRVFLQGVEGRPRRGQPPFTAAYFLEPPDETGASVMIDRRDLLLGPDGVLLTRNATPSWLEYEKGVEWTYEPGVRLLPPGEPAVGGTWTWRGRSTAKHFREGARPAADASATFEVEAQEVMNVPAGRFTCWRVRTRWTGAGGVETVRWWAKDVGLVREEQRAGNGRTLVLELVARDVERPTGD